MKIPIFEHTTIHPLQKFGFTHKFWDLHIDTLIYTWVAMSILFALIIAGRFYFKRQVVNPFSFALEKIIDFFVDLCNDSFGFFSYDYFAFIMALFTFVLFCNAAGMLPFMSEPSEDLNTALACGICSFLYVQWQKIKVVGVIGYFKEFFEPIFILFPLNIVGELAKVASMSFRLFGNILGGSIIVVIALKSIEPYRIHFMIYTAIALPLIWVFSKVIDLREHRIVGPILSINNLVVFIGAWLLMFFGLFEGVVQAFVITMLTVTYLSLVNKQPESEGAHP
ncbi:F0F1 ATP synthase subunit A [Candidatus Dependentiae bacterium]|nr:F0F1 ATP synthase subunit A [Candidatus Dependentiae bacterium]